MYVKHAALTTPPPETVIWRYQDLGKFLSTAERKGLFFSRLDRLPDPHEGAVAFGDWFVRRMVA